MSAFSSSSTKNTGKTVKMTLDAGSNIHANSDDAEGLIVAIEQRNWGTKDTVYPLRHPCQIPYGIVTSGHIGEKVDVRITGNVLMPIYAGCSNHIFNVSAADVGYDLVAEITLTDGDEPPYVGEYSSTRTHPLPSAATIGKIIEYDTTNQKFTLAVHPRPGACRVVDYMTDINSGSIGDPMALDLTSGQPVYAGNLTDASTAIPLGIKYGYLSYGGASYTRVITGGVCRMETAKLFDLIGTPSNPVSAGYRINRRGEITTNSISTSSANTLTLATLAERILDPELIPMEQKTVLVNVCPAQGR